MSSQQKIKTAFERNAKLLLAKPSIGLGTGISRSRIINGLTCEITEGNWKLIADMPEAAGGNASAPKPGTYGRAALGSCLAISYMMYASKMDLSLDLLEVEVQTDYNDGGLFGTSDLPPGYQEVRYTVTIESKASEEELEKMLDEAERHSPYLDVFNRDQPCIRTVKINSTKR